MNNIYEQVMTTLYSVWQKRWYGLAAMWAVCLVGWAIVAMIPNQYESKARLYAQWSSLLPNKLGIEGTDSRRQVQVVKDTLTSRPNLEKVVRRTGLDQGIENDKELDQLINSLSENITVTEQDGNLFSLSYVSNNSNFGDSENATMAQRVVQNLINIFVEENISSDRDNINQAIRFLEDQLAQRGRELEEAERRRAEFEQRYLGRLPGEGNMNQRVMSTQMELDRLAQEIVQARSSLGALQSQLASTPPTISAPSFVVNMGGSRYEPSSARGRIEQLEASITAAYARGWTDQHPDVVAARQQIERLRRQAAREPAAASQQGAQANPVYVNLRSLVFDKQSQVAALTARRALLERYLSEWRERQVEEPGIAAEMAKLNRDYDVLRRQYDQLVKSREEVRLRMDVENKTDQVRFQIVDPPSKPLKPVAPNRPLLLTGVLIGGLLAGIAVAFLASQIHTTYVTSHRLEEAFGVPVLGSVSEVVSDQQRAQNRLWARGFAVLAAGLVGAYAMLMVYQVVLQGGGAA